jgi:hypothetical protein
MKATLLGIYDRGNLANERVHFRLTADVDVSFFLVLDSFHPQPHTVATEQKSCYWFPTRPAKAGENVVLYTRAGTPNTETHSNGQIYHFAFRGLQNPLYARPEASAVLVEIQSWNAST